MDLFIHMKGSHIGALNIYQAPVVGFAIKKLSLNTDQGQNWFERQIHFDSDTEFQVGKEQMLVTKKYVSMLWILHVAPWFREIKLREPSYSTVNHKQEYTGLYWMQCLYCFESERPKVETFMVWIVEALNKKRWFF